MHRDGEIQMGVDSQMVDSQNPRGWGYHSDELRETTEEDASIAVEPIPQGRGYGMDIGVKGYGNNRESEQTPEGWGKSNRIVEWIETVHRDSSNDSCDKTPGKDVTSSVATHGNVCDLTQGKCVKQSMLTQGKGCDPTQGKCVKQSMLTQGEVCDPTQGKGCDLTQGKCVTPSMLTQGEGCDPTQGRSIGETGEQMERLRGFAERCAKNEDPAWTDMYELDEQRVTVCAAQKERGCLTGTRIMHKGREEKHLTKGRKARNEKEQVYETMIGDADQNNSEVEEVFDNDGSAAPRRDDEYDLRLIFARYGTGHDANIPSGSDSGFDDACSLESLDVEHNNGDVMESLATNDGMDVIQGSNGGEKLMVIDDGTERQSEESIEGGGSVSMSDVKGVMHHRKFHYKVKKWVSGLKYNWMRWKHARIKAKEIELKDRESELREDEVYVEKLWDQYEIETADLQEREEVLKQEYERLDERRNEMSRTG